MRIERDFALIQLNDTETRQWHGPRGKARAGVQRAARELAAALANDLCARVEICGDGGDVLEVVEAESAQTATV